MNLKKFKPVAAPVKYLDGEKWTELKINSRNKYLVSTKGRIYSYARDRILKGRICSGVLTLDVAPGNNKEPLYNIYTGKKRSTRSGRMNYTYQQLVAMTFIPKPPGTSIVIHKNYNIRDNSVENLVWIDKKGSMIASSKSPRFKRSRSGKLSLEQVKQLKELLVKKRRGELSLNMKQIAAIFHITDMQVYRIQNGDCFSKVGKPVKKKQQPIKLSSQQVRKIKLLLTKGHTGASIAKKIGINETRVSRIRNERYYKDVAI